MKKISKSNKIARRRFNLWKSDPHCYWCHRELTWLETTLDHMNQKTKLGDEVRPMEGQRVLSCKTCNNQRQINAFNEMNKVKQWLRDNNVPKIRRAWGNRSTPIYARLWLIYYHLKNQLTMNT